MKKRWKGNYFTEETAMTKSMMIVSTLDELRSARSILDGPVGWCRRGLLRGHLSLVAAPEECTSVVVSIFVNAVRSQRGPAAIRMERDLRLLESLGVDLVASCRRSCIQAATRPVR
jgi:pantothenate synthetase